MCGIAGYFGHRGTLSDSLERSLANMAHRGPDDLGSYEDGTVAIGQTRLSIIDLAGGHQPLFSVDGELALVTNGEIYNFIELTEELKKRGHRFLTRSDSEVILHCYAEYGDEFLEHLNGMFAIALYDKTRKRLILGRDRLGIKPLYYNCNGSGFTFASEIKALLPLLDQKPGIDPVGLVGYLQNQFSTGATTVFEGIKRVLPGEVLFIEQGQITEHRTYWSPLMVEPRAIDHNEAQEEFDRLMDTVMVEHIRSDVPFGLFLSGGSDSAILLALLSKLKDEPIGTFSVGFPGTSLVDELPAAGAMAKLFGSRHTVITPTADEIYGVMPLTIWAADDLMRDYASLPTCILSQAAASELKVVFSGEGGDEVFGGYGRYRTPWAERFGKSLLAPGSGGFRTRGTFRGHWPKELFGPKLNQANNDFRKPFINAWTRTPQNWTALKKMQYIDLVTAMPDNLLVKADRMMMAWGLEGRVPFLDHRIVEFGLSLPDHLKVRSGQGKLFLKKWASRFIPEDHLFTPKKGFHVPVGEWLDEELQRNLRQLLIRHPAIVQWFHPAGVAQLIARSRESSVMSRMLWSIVQFAIWHRIFVEGSGERPPVNSDILEFLE
jgi:asparagine synthase (glutamine-hydrolysing)